MIINKTGNTKVAVKGSNNFSQKFNIPRVLLFCSTDWSNSFQNDS